MISNLELRNMSLAELCELKAKVQKLIDESHTKHICPECGCWPDEGHGSGCVAVQ